MIKFVNRECELADLEDLWQRKGTQLVVVYGRRRTGKTAFHRVRTAWITYTLLGDNHALHKRSPEFTSAPLA
jgi:hypothetical protein